MIFLLVFVFKSKVYFWGVILMKWNIKSQLIQMNFIETFMGQTVWNTCVCLLEEELKYKKLL